MDNNKVIKTLKNAKNFRVLLFLTLLLLLICFVNAEAYNVDNYERMPYKNQKSINENWLSYVNSEYSPSEGSWNIPNENEDNFSQKCISYASSTILDYFILISGGILGQYQNFVNNRTENGTNPRNIEEMYRYKSSSDWLGYPTISTDQLTKEPITAWLNGFAKTITNPSSNFMHIDDTNLDNYNNYSINQDSYSHLSGYKPIINTYMLGYTGKTRLKNIIKQYGPILAWQTGSGTYYFLSWFDFGVHANVVVGYNDTGSDILFTIHESVTGDNSDLITGSSLEDYVKFIAFYDPQWPTYHHDYRRTGFTTLRGDMTSSNQVRKTEWTLDTSGAPSAIDHPSIADLDGNGKQEVVITTSKYSAPKNGTVYSIERGWSSFSEKWNTNIGNPIPAAPSLADLDEDGIKDVVFGLRNMTLFVLDGDDGTLLWTNTTQCKYSAYVDDTVCSDLGNTAIYDIDLDGDKEVIFTDAVTTNTIYDWPGELYILDKNGNYVDSVTVGNGGAWGAPAIANVDSDDYPEIFIPTFYGIKAYDFDGSSLSLKWSNDDGKIEGAPVLFDVDRDNEYEIIYSTSTKTCPAAKTCMNFTYILDAETGNQERSISIDAISRVAPAVANIIDDSDIELVLQVQDTASSTTGQILCYVANDGNVCAGSWPYTGGGSLETFTQAPIIADIDNDGEYNIIFGAKDNKTYFLKQDGTLLFSYEFDGQLGSSPAIGDIDNDGMGEIAVRHEGSNILSELSGLNHQPLLNNISNISITLQQLIYVNESGEIWATDEDNDTLTFYYGAPFNETGYWQTTANNTGNYSVLIEVSDGNLSDWQYINVEVNNTNRNLYANIKTLNETYYANEFVNITDPPEDSLGPLKIANNFFTRDSAWEILKQDYISKYISFNFIYLNDSYYRVDWKWNNKYVKDVLMQCSHTKIVNKDQCVNNLSKIHFAPSMNHTEIENLKYKLGIDTSVNNFTNKYFSNKKFYKIGLDVENAKQNAMPADITKGNAAIIGTLNPFLNDEGFILINMEDGFYGSDGLTIKFGLNTTIAEFNNSKSIENLTFSGEENLTRYIRLNRYTKVYNTQINLSGFEREPEGTYVTEYLIGSSGNGDALGIDNNGTHLFVTDGDDSLIYIYEINGTFTGTTINLSLQGFNQSRNPYGIAVNNTFAWVVKEYSNDPTVYKYFLNGTYGDENYSVSDDMSAPESITQNNSFFWITDYPLMTVDIYHMNGTHSGETFSISNIGHANPDRGITNDNSNIWISDRHTDKVYKYYMNGSDTSFNFSIASETDNSRDITVDGSFLYVTDANINRIFKYWKSVYPSNPYIEVGNADSNFEWYYADKFNQINSQMYGFASELNAALNSGACDCSECLLDGDNCTIPVLFHSDTAGKIEYSDIVIEYGEDNESKVRNDGITNVSVYLLMKIQFFNGSEWLDEEIIKDDSSPRVIEQGVSNQLKLDAIWNPNAWNVSSSSYGLGTYRAYVAVTDENNVVLVNEDGSEIVATYNFTYGAPDIVITSFQSVFSNESLEIFEFKIKNNGTSNLSLINWTIDFGDGNSAESIYTFNLTVDEQIFVYVAHNYSVLSQGYDVTVSTYVDNINDSKKIRAGLNDLQISSFKELHSFGREKIWEFVIKNNANSTLSDINWNITGTDADISSIYSFNLTSNETIMVYVHENLSNFANYTITAKAFTDTQSDTETLDTRGKELEVSNFKTLYTNGLVKVYEFLITNTFTSAINNINWSLNTGEESIDAIYLFNLSSSENIRVLVENQYSASSNYTINASAKSSSYDDYENKTIIW